MFLFLFLHLFFDSVFYLISDHWLNIDGALRNRGSGGDELEPQSNSLRHLLGKSFILTVFHSEKLLYLTNKV